MKKNDLKPVYLVVGPDKLKVKTVIKRLEDRMSEISDLALNYYTFDGEQDSADKIINSYNTLPFISEYKLLKIENANKVKSDDFIKICKNPNDFTIMLLICNKLARTTKLYKAIPAECIIKCDLPKPYQFSSVVVNIARKNDVNISQSAAQHLINLCGQDTILIDNQINKIKSAIQKKSIDLQDVIDNVERSNEPKPWDFVNSFASKNLNKSLSIYRQLKTTSEFALLSLLCKRIHELICAKSLKNKTTYNLANKLELQSWQIKSHIADSEKFSLQELEKILYNALICEAKLKSGSNTNSIFENFIICSLNNIKDKYA